MNLQAFLGLAAEVTEARVRSRDSGPWTTKAMLLKICEEYTELVESVAWNDRGVGDDGAVLEEGWDVIFAVLTLFHIRGFGQADVASAGLAGLDKIRERVGLSTGVLGNDL